MPELTPRSMRAFKGDFTWEEKARRNPLYAVMSVDEFEKADPEPHPADLERFYSEGVLKANRWLRPWLLETDSTDEMRILEFGCGMGRLLHGLSTFHPASRLYGVDISETMVGHARNNVPGITAEAIRPDGSFPFPDAHFDRVYSYAVFQHIAKGSVVRRSIAEIARVLKPGGELKIQFEMLSPPPFVEVLPKDTIAFEDTTLLYGFSRRYKVPIPATRIVRSDNWAGIRLGYHQLVGEFRRNGIRIYGIRSDFPRERMVWFYGSKLIPPND